MPNPFIYGRVPDVSSLPTPEPRRVITDAEREALAQELLKAKLRDLAVAEAEKIAREEARLGIVREAPPISAEAMALADAALS